MSQPDANEKKKVDYLSYEQVINETTEKATEYHSTTTKLSIIGKIVSLVFVGSLVIFKFPNLLRDISPFGRNYSVFSIGFVLVIIIILEELISLPLSIYSEKIERKYEFATRENKEWIKDKIKSLLLILVIGIILVEALFLALHQQPDLWWIYAFVGYFIFASILQTLSPYLISLFTEIEPLEEGEVRDVVENLAKRMGLSYKDIYLWKLSEQTTKANAAVIGFGASIKIILGDTLVDNFRPDEIEVVMAHEIAHQQNNDVYRHLLFNGLLSLIAFYLVDLGFETAMSLFDLLGKSDPAAIGYIWFVMILVMEVLGKLALYYSRRREKAADIVAIKELGDLQVYESAFARLSKQNLSFPNPSKLEVWYHYSHPPIKQRIEYAKNYVK